MNPSLEQLQHISNLFSQFVHTQMVLWIQKPKCSIIISCQLTDLIVILATNKYILSWQISKMTKCTVHVIGTHCHMRATEERHTVDKMTKTMVVWVKFWLSLRSTESYFLKKRKVLNLIEEIWFCFWQMHREMKGDLSDRWLCYK